MVTPPAVAVVLAPMRRADLPRVLEIEVAVSSRPWTDAAFLIELNREDRRYLVARSIPGAAGGTEGGAAGGTEGGAAGGIEDATADATADGEVVGFGGVALFPEEAHVMTLAVDRRAQGRGVGAQVVAGMLDEVARAGRRAVTLEVRASNGPARRLYRRAGFEDSGVRPAYYPDGEDAVIMWRHDVEVS
jgi:ribosomal-protein-alanine acetyltransferase